MAWNDKYANFDLATGANDGTSEADAWQTPADLNSGAMPGDRIWVKKTASPLTLAVGDSNLTLGSAGTLLNPIELVGYGSTPGDGVRFEVLFTFSERILYSNEHSIFRNFKFEGTTTSVGSFTGHTNNSVAINCVVRCRGFAVAHAYLCDIEVGGAGYCTAQGVNNCNSEWANNLIKQSSGGTAPQLVYRDMFDTHFTFRNNIVAGANSGTTKGMQLHRMSDSRGVSISGNIFYNTAGDGINFHSESTSLKRVSCIMHNIFAEIGGYGINSAVTPTGQIKLRSNFFRNCTSGPSIYADEFVDDEVLLTADPFIDAANDDFGINAVAGGGAVIRAAVRNINQLDPTSSLIRSLAHFMPELGGGVVTHAFFG